MPLGFRTWEGRTSATTHEPGDLPRAWSRVRAHRAGVPVAMLPWITKDHGASVVQRDVVRDAKPHVERHAISLRGRPLQGTIQLIV